MNSPVDRSYRWLFWTLALIGFGLDQASKYGVFAHLYTVAVPNMVGSSGEIEVVGGAFKLLAQFTRERDSGEGVLTPLRTWSSDVLPQVNRGAFFGLGGRNSQGWDANTIFAAVSFLAASAIVFWSARANTRRDRFLCVTLGMILAGTLGNLYDRLVFGGVRDFLYWYYAVDWPVFNFADCCLVCGAGLLLLQAFFTEPHKVPVNAATSVEPEVAQAEHAQAEHNTSAV